MNEPIKHWDKYYCFNCGCLVSEQDEEANKRTPIPSHISYPVLHFTRCNSCFNVFLDRVSKIELKRALLK